MNPEYLIRAAKMYRVSKEIKESNFVATTPEIPKWVADEMLNYWGAFNVFGALQAIHQNEDSDIHKWVFEQGHVDEFAIAFMLKFKPNQKETKK